MAERKVEKESKSRRHLRAGMANVAIKAKVNGTPEVDCVGRPLRYANEMAGQCNIKTLTKLQRGGSVATVTVGFEICKTCHRVGEYCKCVEELNGAASSHVASREN